VVTAAALLFAGSLEDPHAASGSAAAITARRIGERCMNQFLSYLAVAGGRPYRLHNDHRRRRLRASVANGKTQS
jgi:hypothetical protein